MAPPGIDPDPDGTFRLCVQFSQFRAKLNNGSSVDVPRSLFQWDADYRCYNLEMLHKDLEAKVNWGSGQQLVIHAFDMSGGGERKLVDDVELALAFSDRMDDKKLFLFVDIVDKPSEVFCSSAIIEAAVSNVHDNAVGEEDGNQEAFVSSLIDWDSLEIAPIAEEQIGAAFPVMSEEAMYEFVGLRAEDERAEQARIAAEQAANLDDLELQDGELLVDDDVPGENSVLYDKENPPMTVGTIYASMDEFRAAVRQHGIMGQFELGTEKSCKKVFRGYCKTEDCPWSIVARLMQDEQQVRVINRFIRRKQNDVYN